jgi:hypothetical protein
MDKWSMWAGFRLFEDDLVKNSQNLEDFVVTLGDFPSRVVALSWISDLSV